MLYTRKGDTGTSGLFGTKERFPKNSPVYDALGTLDELNALLGVCYAIARRESRNTHLSIASFLRNVQQHLFIVQAEIAGAPKQMTQTHVDAIEKMIEELEKQIENPHSFVIPGATELAGFLDYARTVSRRAERIVVTASAVRDMSDSTSAYLNRLSSLLYALARYAATTAVVGEERPAY